MSARLVRAAGLDRDEAEADTLAAAWEVVTRRPPPGRWERARLHLERRLAGSAGRGAVQPRDRVRSPTDFDVAEPERDRLERWPGLWPPPWPPGCSRPTTGRRRSPRPGWRDARCARWPVASAAPTTPCARSAGGPRRPCAPSPCATPRRRIVMVERRERMRSTSAGVEVAGGVGQPALERGAVSPRASMARAPSSQSP